MATQPSQGHARETQADGGATVRVAPEKRGGRKKGRERGRQKEVGRRRGGEKGPAAMARSQGGRPGIAHRGATTAARKKKAQAGRRRRARRLRPSNSHTKHPAQKATGRGGGTNPTRGEHRDEPEKASRRASQKASRARRQKRPCGGGPEGANSKDSDGEARGTRKGQKVQEGGQRSTGEPSANGTRARRRAEALHKREPTASGTQGKRATKERH